jgi:hypothetical protein
VRTLLIIAALAAPAAADSKTAQVTIEHRDGWQHGSTKPISIRIGSSPWRQVAAGQTTAAVDVPVAASGSAIAFDVQVPSGSKSFRRWAALVPGATYRVVGNACARWGLELDGKPPGDPEHVRLDARNLPATAFPLVISSSDSETASDTTAILDKPGMSAPIELPVSAMCPRSGTRVTVRSRSSKKLLFDQSLIPHPGRLHTLRLVKPGFELFVEP